MKFPLFFKRQSTSVASKNRQDQAEKLFAESLRMMGQVFGKLADVVEAQRLNRAGYEDQEKFLERTDKKEKE